MTEFSGKIIRPAMASSRAHAKWFSRKAESNNGCPKAAVVIPARMESRRFPGKPLALIDGLPMILRTLRGAQQAQTVEKVVVATDSVEIARVVEATGATIIRTGHCISGTERVSVAAEQLPKEFDIVVNVQGDEPTINPKHIDGLVSDLTSDKREVVTTLATPIHSLVEWRNQNVVKVVLSASGHALYFSRAQIPFSSQKFQFDSETTSSRSVPSRNMLSSFEQPLRHVGVYGFRRGFLKRIPFLGPAGILENEDLEQLRWMHAGVEIKVRVVDQVGPEVNTPGDVQAVEKYIRESQA